MGKELTGMCGAVSLKCSRPKKIAGNQSGYFTVVPPQLLPAPAVQPKQCESKTISRSARRSSWKSHMVFGSPLLTGMFSI